MASSDFTEVRNFCHGLKMVYDCFYEMSNYDNLPIEDQKIIDFVLHRPVKILRIEEELANIDQLITKFGFRFSCAGVVWRAFTKHITDCHKAQQYPSIIPAGVHEDQLVRYALNNIIPEGHQRRAKLFKILSIIFVQNKYTDEEIDPYACFIVKNCPGTTKQDFMGWVRWARKTNAKFYPHEANKWILNNIKNGGKT